MMAAGLRREEIVSLRFENVIKQDKRYVLNVKGKGSKNRVVPISNLTGVAIADRPQSKLNFVSRIFPRFFLSCII